MRAPGPGSMWILRRLDSMRIPPVCLFWVIVVNLPPPVPRKTISVSFIFCTEDTVDEGKLFVTYWC